MNGNHNSVARLRTHRRRAGSLLARIDEAMPVDPVLHLHFTLPLSNGRAIALVHALGRVLHSEVQDSTMAIEAEIPESVARQLRIGPDPTLA